MCLAIFKPANKSFNRDHITTAWRNNPHGAGLAIRTKNAVEIYKGFMTLDGLSSFLNDNESFLEAHDVVLHLRWSTSGTIKPGLCHPFPASKNNNDLLALELVTDTALIHNGVMFQPNLNDYSDTAIFSRYFAHFAPSLKQINKVIKNDRLAIVTKDGVKMLGFWEVKGDCFYSNTYSLETNNYNFDFKDDYLKEYFFECPICGSESVDHIGINSNAHECLDCHSVFNGTDFILDDDKNTKKSESVYLQNDDYFLDDLSDHYKKVSKGRY
jgi:predicted glutamine amidotransferase